MGEGWGGGEITRYFYDGEDILVEYDGAGNAGNKYTHGPGIDEPLALTNDKGNYYYHADGLGSIVAITDKDQTVVQDYQYDWYGNLKDLKNRIKQPYAYTGREFDRETGLYFYRARYYDASVGRFLTRDPIGFRGGMNKYAYVKANPIRWNDPFGLITQEERVIQLARGIAALALGASQVVSATAVTAGTAGVATPVGFALFLSGSVLAEYGMFQIIEALTTPTDDEALLKESLEHTVVYACTKNKAAATMADVVSLTPTKPLSTLEVIYTAINMIDILISYYGESIVE